LGDGRTGGIDCVSLKPHPTRSQNDQRKVRSRNHQERESGSTDRGQVEIVELHSGRVRSSVIAW
jgi:hypothetical protein